jgi:hypothetical protein
LGEFLIAFIAVSCLTVFCCFFSLILLFTFHIKTNKRLANLVQRLALPIDSLDSSLMIKLKIGVKVIPITPLKHLIPERQVHFQKVIIVLLEITQTHHFISSTFLLCIWQLLQLNQVRPENLVEGVEGILYKWSF